MGKRLLAGLALAGTTLLTACTSTAAKPDTSPLPTRATSGQFVCAFVDKISLQVALGIKDLNANNIVLDGRPVYYEGQERNPDGGRLAQANCGVTVLQDSTPHARQVFGAQVEQLADRPDIVQQIVDDTAGGRPAADRFPSSYGLGIAYPGHGGNVELLRGDWFVLVGISDPAKGRGPVKDAVALTEQIVATLKLPATHRQPYPKPTTSR